MKVLNGMLASGMGGMEQMSVTYLKALVHNGDEVHALYMADSPYLEELKALGVHLHLMKSRSIYNPFNAIKVAKIIQQVNPDAVILHGNRAMRLARYPLIKKIFPIFAPLIGKAHNFDCKYLPDMDASIATTRYWTKELALLTHKPVFYLPNTVALTPARAPKFHTPPVIGTIGRLHVNKGYDILLKACKILKDKGVDFRLTIGGEGPEKNKLLNLMQKEGLEDFVHFAGWIKDKDTYYDTFDVFCLSSRTEPFGTVVLEAMVRYCPVVTTDCAGPVEMIEDGKTGLIVPINQPEKLAQALEKMISNPQQAQKMAERARQKVEQEYAFDIFAKDLRHLLLDVIKNYSDTHQS